MIIEHSPLALVLCMLIAAIRSSSFRLHSYSSSKAAPSHIIRMSSSGVQSSKIILRGVEWTNMNLSSSQLRPHLTLKMGQSFAWKMLYDDCDNGGDAVWVGVVDEIPVAIRETAVGTFYCNLRSPKSVGGAGLGATLYNYFQLDADYEHFYAQWAGGCDRMKAVTQALQGVRVLRQDPWETLVSFICSSNNNIKRISLMLGRLRVRYGTYICTVRPSTEEGSAFEVAQQEPDEALLASMVLMGSPSSSPSSSKKRRVSEEEEEEGEGEGEALMASEGTHHLYTFPSPQALARATDEALREMGMGYRAKFLKGSAGVVLQKGSGWLEGLRARGPHERLAVQEQLMECPGVGRKVADCVALFSLDQVGSVPVDVHVWDIAVRDYDNSGGELKKTKSLTPVVYERVGDLFRQRFGSHAGWAHSVLFAGELPEFRRRLPTRLQEEMRLYEEEKRGAAAAAKRAKADVKKMKKEKEEKE